MYAIPNHISKLGVTATRLPSTSIYNIGRLHQPIQPNKKQKPILLSDKQNTSQLDKFIHDELSSSEWHLPFHKYAGPGTHIINNLQQHVQPTTALDRISRHHDIEYLKPNNQQQADSEMVEDLLREPLYPPVIGAATYAAFKIKDFLHLKDNDKTDINAYQYAKELEQIEEFNQRAFHRDRH